MSGVPLVAVVLLAIAGAGLSFLDVSGRTLLQRTVSDEALGRVFGLLESGYMAAWAIGSSVAPLVLRLLGLGWSFVVTGALVPVATLLWWRRLSKVDKEAPLPGPEVEMLKIHRHVPLAVRIGDRADGPEPGRGRGPAGSTIIREGEPGDLFYAIAYGEVG